MLRQLRIAMYMYMYTGSRGLCFTVASGVHTHLWLWTVQLLMGEVMPLDGTNSRNCSWVMLDERVYVEWNDLETRSLAAGTPSALTCIVISFVVYQTVPAVPAAVFWTVDNCVCGQKRSKFWSVLVTSILQCTMLLLVQHCSNMHCIHIRTCLKGRACQRYILVLSCVSVSSKTRTVTCILYCHWHAYRQDFKVLLHIVLVHGMQWPDDCIHHRSRVESQQSTPLAVCHIVCVCAN